ncbi:MAG: class I SAM-dependent methyltransferase [Chloroflexi bacterium]|nr:class I SAM-dependent methyltransferase [Chloroflexota bacterium]
MRTRTPPKVQRAPLWQAPLLALAGLVVLVAVAAARAISALRPRQRVPHRMAPIAEPEMVQAYARVAQMPQMRVMSAWVARNALRDKRFKRALDLGCGPGWLALELARMQPGLAVVGLDTSTEILDVARRNLERAGLEAGVSFHQGSAERLPFPDDYFDLVVSTLSLHHWEDPIGAFNQVNRVLQPGGRFVIFDIRRDVPGPAWLVAWLVRTFIAPPLARRLDEPLASARAAYTPDEVRALAERSNLHGWKVTTGPLWLMLESKA